MIYVLVPSTPRAHFKDHSAAHASRSLLAAGALPSPCNW